MRILFASIIIAYEMGVLKVFTLRNLFASRPVACEMGVLKDFIVRICLLASPLHVKWVFQKFL